MSEIKVDCPECLGVVTLETEVLKKTDGRAVCPHCAHTFKLVKKAKKKAASETQPAPKSNTKKAHLTNNDVIDAPASKSEKSQRAWFGRGQKPMQAAPVRKTVAELSALQRTQTPLAYREPKAQAVPTFAEVGAQDAFTFNLLDRDSVNAQMPQISVQPALDKSVATSAKFNNDGQQNHITIHTDSLVFTLVGDGNNASNTLPSMSMGNLPSTQVNPVTAPAPVVVQAATVTETNWTVATIAAMAILVMQLFYWLLTGA